MLPDGRREISPFFPPTCRYRSAHSDEAFNKWVVPDNPSDAQGQADEHEQSLVRREHELDRRYRTADERDLVADERDQIASDR
jgi:hypothetical protein